MLLASSNSLLQLHSCRCYTHLGASMDSRAGF
ncbi:hypothetical protein [Buttiauxella noackiae]